MEKKICFTRDAFASVIMEEITTTTVSGLTSLGGGGSSGSGSLSCFPAGTQICLADWSSKNIEKIRLGDMVMGFNGNNHIAAIVEELESPIRDHYYLLKMEDGSNVKLTMEHPVFTNNGWKSISPESTLIDNSKLIVSKLSLGDGILDLFGIYKIVQEIIYVPGSIMTYNLKRLSRGCEFYANNLLVHNKA